jgi:hypothetical protein
MENVIKVAQPPLIQLNCASAGLIAGVNLQGEQTNCRGQIVSRSSRAATKIIDKTL